MSPPRMFSITPPHARRVFARIRDLDAIDARRFAREERREAREGVARLAANVAAIRALDAAPAPTHRETRR